jgi:hypothetical protein
MQLRPILASCARSGVSMSLDANHEHYRGFRSDHVATPGPEGNGVSIYLTDPEGNTVELKGPSDGSPVPPRAP